MAEEQAIKQVMGIFAHPDDPEFFCGGTFARWAAEGAQITFVLATSGDKGSSDPEMTTERLVAIREQEERNAAAVLGVKEVVFLRYTDGELLPTLGLRRDITRLIRQHKPEVVVTCDPTVFWWGSNGINHPDHRAIGAATLEAVYPTARDRLNFPELVQEGYAPHKVLHVYISGPAQHTHKVDVTQHIDKKIEALREHKSQILDMEAMARRIYERTLDPESPADFPRHVEYFRVITLT